jgi:hypothetical protein
MVGSGGMPGMVVPSAAIIAKKAIELPISNGTGPGGGGGIFAMVSIFGIGANAAKVFCGSKTAALPLKFLAEPFAP